MTVYEQINECNTHIGLGNVIENFLNDIGQNSPSETYEETADRLRAIDLIDEAEVMDYAADKWWQIEEVSNGR